MNNYQVSRNFNFKCPFCRENADLFVQITNETQAEITGIWQNMIVLDYGSTTEIKAIDQIAGNLYCWECRYSSSDPSMDAIKSMPFKQHLDHLLKQSFITLIDLEPIIITEERL